MRILIKDTAAAATTNHTGVKVRKIDLISCAATVSSGSTPNITVKLQASDDNTNWVDISGASSTITSDTTDIIEVADFASKWIRVVETVNSGSGDIKIILSGKERAIV